MHVYTSRAHNPTLATIFINDLHSLANATALLVHILTLTLQINKVFHIYYVIQMSAL